MSRGTQGHQRGRPARAQDQGYRDRRAAGTLEHRTIAQAVPAAVNLQPTPANRDGIQAQTYQESDHNGLPAYTPHALALIQPNNLGNLPRQQGGPSAYANRYGMQVASLDANQYGLQASAPAYANQYDMQALPRANANHYGMQAYAPPPGFDMASAPPAPPVQPPPPHQEAPFNSALLTQTFEGIIQRVISSQVQHPGALQNSQAFQEVTMGRFVGREVPQHNLPGAFPVGPQGPTLATTPAPAQAVTGALKMMWPLTGYNCVFCGLPLLLVDGEPACTCPAYQT